LAKWLEGGEIMKLEFWGTRGSIPTPSGKTPYQKEIVTNKYGGNTTCMRIIGDDNSEHIIDAGTGIRELGAHLGLRDGKEGSKTNLYFTHTHWDHIQGLPFFGPAYNPNSDIKIFAEAKVKYDLGNTILGHSEYNTNGEPVERKVMMIEGPGIKNVLMNQQTQRNFPVPLEVLKGIKSYYDFVPGTTLGTNGVNIETFPLNHPGGCVGYKIKNEKGIIVITTDFEQGDEEKDNLLKKMVENADVWVCDGQYENGSQKNPFIKGWGHSDPFYNLNVALETGVKKMIVTHHEPKMNDDYHTDLEERVRQYTHERLNARNLKDDGLKVYLAKEGDVYNL